jgi:SAM-dependent methyltransferase
VQHDFQSRYWNAVAHASRFDNPLDFETLEAHLPKSARILDLGCGYGRVLEQIQGRGYHRAEGADTSAEMVERARRSAPHAKVTHYSELPTPFASSAFDGVLLFHVLCSVPASDAQEALVAELVRVLRPGGILYLSDLPLQSDERNLTRYQRFASRLGVYGTFELEGGGVFRHHSEEWFQHLLTPFEELWSRRVPMKTMHGNPVIGYQLVGRRR